MAGQMTPGSSSNKPWRQVYGLSIASDLDLPELHAAPTADAPDIRIEQGAVPELTERDPNNVRAYVDGEPGHLVLDFPDKLRVLVSQGTTITYSRYPGATDSELRLYMLGSAMGAILMQRGHIVVHGNALVLPQFDGAAICIGDSGAGKSTTAIAMMQRGYRILADDVCPITAEGIALSGMPRAKMWDDTAQQLRIDTSSLARLRLDEAKFDLPLDPSQRGEPEPARAFFELVPEDVDEVSVSPLSGTQKFMTLRNNIYRPEYLLPLKLEAEYLQRVAKIAASTPIFRVTRPTQGFDIDSVLDAILETAERHSAV